MASCGAYARVVPATGGGHEVRRRVDAEFVPILHEFFGVVEQHARTRPEVAGPDSPGAIGHKRVVPAGQVLLRVGG